MRSLLEKLRATLPAGATSVCSGLRFSGHEHTASFVPAEAAAAASHGTSRGWYSAPPLMTLTHDRLERQMPPGCREPSSHCCHNDAFGAAPSTQRQPRRPKCVELSSLWKHGTNRNRWGCMSAGTCGCPSGSTAGVFGAPPTGAATPSAVVAVGARPSTGGRPPRSIEGGLRTSTRCFAVSLESHAPSPP